MTDSEKKSHLMNILKDVARRGSVNGREYLENMADRIMNDFVVITAITEPAAVIPSPLEEKDEQPTKKQKNN